jgi:hypothetical protein
MVGGEKPPTSSFFKNHIPPIPSGNFSRSYGKSPDFNGKTHYFYGHFHQHPLRIRCRQGMPWEVSLLGEVSSSPCSPQIWRLKEIPIFEGYQVDKK